MAYTDYAFYTSLHTNPALAEADFNRLLWEACRKLDVETTGIDGIKKLRVAFPSNEDDAEAVKRCACKLVTLLYQIEEAEKSVSSGRGYVETENGVRGKVITSVSSGAESISYSYGNSPTYSGSATLIDKALADKAVQDKLFRDTIREYLSGISDANGVNLLYMGVYPRV